MGIIGSDVNPIWMPDIARFTERVESLGIETQTVVCGRDQNILTHQQTRIRSQPTLDMFMEQLTNIKNPTFLSYELLYLFRQDYLKSLELNIPVAWDNSRIDEILADDANAKYIHAADPYWLDDHVRNILTPPWLKPSTNAK